MTVKLSLTEPFYRIKMDIKNKFY